MFDLTAYESWRELLILCAGCVAKEIYSEEIYAFDEMGCRGDEGSDSARLWDSLEAHSDDVQIQGTWFDLAFSQTRRILSNRAVWRAVDVLADRLLAEQTIDSDEADETITAALGRSKWSLDRYQMGERYASPPRHWIESREEYREMEAVISLAMTGGGTK